MDARPGQLAPTPKKGGAHARGFDRTSFGIGFVFELGALAGLLWTIHVMDDVWGLLSAFLFLPVPIIFCANGIAGFAAAVRKNAAYFSKRALYGSVVGGTVLALLSVGFYIVVGSGAEQDAVRGLLGIGFTLFLVSTLGSGAGVLVGSGVQRLVKRSDTMNNEEPLEKEY